MNNTWTRYLPAFIRDKIEGRHALQEAISNTGWLFADNVLRMGVGLLVSIWVTRYLGPERFGLLSFALAFVTLFSPLVSLGLDDIAVRNIVQDPSCKEETLGTALGLKLVGGMLSFIAASVVVLALRHDDTASCWLVAIIAVGNIFQALSVVECWFNSQVQAKYAVLARCSSFVICAALKIALIVTGASLIAFAWVTLCEVALSSLGLIVAYWLRGGSLRAWRFTRERARILLRDSWPLAFSFIAIVLYQRIDQVMLGEMAGSEEVGIYSVAVRLAEVWVFIPSAVFWSVFPSILKAKAVSDDLFYAQLQKLYNLMTMLAYAVAIPVTFFGQWLVSSLYGEAFARAGLMLVVLTWANVFTNLEYARSAFLNAMNLNRIYFIAVLAGGILNIALNFYLIPRYGGLGAAIASVISYWFAAHGSCFLFKPLTRTGRMMTKAMLYPKVW